MNVCVIGTGYVGLVTGATFADLGNEVVCVDKDESKIARLQRGEMPIYEPGLEEIVRRNMEEGRISFTTDIGEGVRRSLVIFIAVGTPPKDNGETDLSQVESAAIEIAHNMDSYKIIVNKSTVPVGTGDLVRRIVEQHRRRQVDFDVVSNPEFLKEGSAVYDSMHPDRIVIGAPSQHVAMALLELYAPLEVPMLITDVESAEMIKYASNAFLATKISFINAIANICERAGADVTLVAKGMGYDKRIGMEFLQAGLGFGGSCFPKDTLSLRHVARKFGEDSSLLDAVIAINEDRVPRFLRRIEEKMGGVEGKTFGILGLAFKPNTDDLRDAKSLEVIRGLQQRGAKIRAYDPVAMENAKAILQDVVFCKSAYDAAENVDAVVIVTDWNEFKLLNLDKLREKMKQPIIFDGRNIYQPERVKKYGFEYVSIGR
ncbi:MAG: UDP-glucose/GDP-mannose dehydrogenase family protein [Candidatus Sumerlaea chitinivorans]|uniref:UDP-glucose 6-dehydrogenase n=1 Tax=Sumerlaea chitinivorans TaxID=2250252 RepID=A0A2Z4Y6R8_SUMC1|nr:UDP-glucose dehydrogenase [Candidatus Sumerlaea chitinivorans]MCX7963727.1 UDP-glucose/GDP-mannose dehydrogenase family protein [Candidatus Sumerlaea chitinivorans]